MHTKRIALLAVLVSLALPATASAHRQRHRHHACAQVRNVVKCSPPQHIAEIHHAPARPKSVAAAAVAEEEWEPGTALTPAEEQEIAEFVETPAQAAAEEAFERETWEGETDESS
jgi:hypothetical protein